MAWSLTIGMNNYGNEFSSLNLTAFITMVIDTTGNENDSIVKKYIGLSCPIILYANLHSAQVVGNLVYAAPKLPFPIRTNPFTLLRGVDSCVMLTLS